MARFVSISIGGNPTLKLDSMGRATLQITAKNLSGAAFDGRAVAVSLPVASPASGAVQNGWVKIDGSPDLHFERDQEKAIVLKVDVPMRDKPKSGNYQFRVDIVSVAKPDEGDQTSAMSFAVPEIKKNGTNPLVWLIPVLVVVVIGLGVGAWLLLTPKGITVPNLQGQTVSDADATLKAQGLSLDQNNVQTAESKPEDSGKIISQKPEAGQKVGKEQAVQVTVGAQMVTVPMLVGHPFQEVVAILGEKKLTVGQTKTAQNANFAGGVVTNQNPAAQQVVKSGVAVDLDVTPQTVTVPNVSGQTLGNAILSLRGLTVTSFSGDSTKTVVAQNPAAGASVPVGSSVTLSFPPGACVIAIRCIYSGTIARQFVMEQALRAREVQQRGTAPKN